VCYEPTVMTLCYVRPWFQAEIVPQSMVGFIEKRTGKVELEVDADVILSVKPFYNSASVRVPLTLTTETSWGATRSARGKRLDSEAGRNHTTPQELLASYCVAFVSSPPIRSMYVCVKSYRCLGPGYLPCTRCPTRVLIVYQCTRAHRPHPPPRPHTRPASSFPASCPDSLGEL
jgi:hypothetical protein